jgi:hypothetical protein
MLSLLNQRETRHRPSIHPSVYDMSRTESQRQHPLLYARTFVRRRRAHGRDVPVAVCLLSSVAVPHATPAPCLTQRVRWRMRGSSSGGQFPYADVYESGPSQLPSVNTHGAPESACAVGVPAYSLPMFYAVVGRCPPDCTCPYCCLSCAVEGAGTAAVVAAASRDNASAALEGVEVCRTTGGCGWNLGLSASGDRVDELYLPGALLPELEAVGDGRAGLAMDQLHRQATGNLSATPSQRQHRQRSPRAGRDSGADGGAAAAPLARGVPVSATLLLVEGIPVADVLRLRRIIDDSAARGGRNDRRVQASMASPRVEGAAPAPASGAGTTGSTDGAGSSGGAGPGPGVSAAAGTGAEPGAGAEPRACEAGPGRQSTASGLQEEASGTSGGGAAGVGLQGHAGAGDRGSGPAMPSRNGDAGAEVCRAVVPEQAGQGASG